MNFQALADAAETLKDMAVGLTTLAADKAAAEAVVKAYQADEVELAKAVAAGRAALDKTK